jgi:O-antigen ligase
MSFLAIPDKSAIVSTYILTFLFCLPFAGTEELFLFLVIAQIGFIALVYLCFRKEASSIFMAFKKYHPITVYLLAGWLIATYISLILVFNSDANGWQRAFAIARQLFILIQIGFCLSLMRFILVTNTSFHHLLLSFGMGFIGLACLHFAILYWGPACESETWLKDPFLSPNMRDIGDLATAAISIFTISYFFSKKSLHGYGFLGLLTISWAYLFWSGGRTAIASAFMVNFLTIVLCRLYGKLTITKIMLSIVAIIVAYLLCVQFTIYDWNGLVRYSSEWQQNDQEFKGDVTSGRMDMWLWTFKVFLQQPWLGQGPFGFYFIPERFTYQFWHDHPHNLFIQCIIEWGVIGTTFFMALLSTLAITGIKQIKPLTSSQNTGYLAAGGIVLVLTLGSLTGGSYWDYQPVMILVTAFACFPWLPKLLPSKTTGIIDIK